MLHAVKSRFDYLASCPFGYLDKFRANPRTDSGFHLEISKRSKSIVWEILLGQHKLSG